MASNLKMKMETIWSDAELKTGLTGREKVNHCP